MSLDRNTVVTNIRKLLAKRHVDDVFYEEVTIEHGARRMDAWAMKKSWANPMVLAYEIKSSRQDFMSDHKMQDYLPYCNEAYVVCSHSASPSDFEPPASLMAYSFTVSMGCSAAYLLPAATKKIYMSPASETGSVGVQAAWTNLEGFWTKLGIQKVYFHSKFSDKKNLSPATKEGREAEQKLLDETWDLFAGAIAKHRRINASIRSYHPYRMTDSPAGTTASKSP